MMTGFLQPDVALLTGVVVLAAIGVMDVEAAFSGFGHPATVIIALVLIVSRGLFASGAIEPIKLKWFIFKPFGHLYLMRNHFYARSAPGGPKLDDIYLLPDALFQLDRLAEEDVDIEREDLPAEKGYRVRFVLHKKVVASY